MLYDYSGVYAELPGTVDYIREMLSESPSLNLRNESDSEGEPLKIENDLDSIDFKGIEPDSRIGAVCAVDGGQGTIIRNSLFMAVVYRAGYIKFLDRKRVSEKILPLRLANITRENYSKICGERYFESYERMPSVMPDFSETSGYLRSIAEQDILDCALDELDTGDLLLMDGSLRNDKDGFLEDFLTRAGKRDIDIAAVSKASGILWRGGAGLTAVIKHEGDKRIPEAKWFAGVGKTAPGNTGKFMGDVFVASLNPHSRLAFRIDLSRNNKSEPSYVFARIAAYCSDAFFLGYPYPLAAVHQAVRMAPDDLNAFLLRLRDLAAHEGISRNGWDILFEDYHRVLNNDLHEGQRGY